MLERLDSTLALDNAILASAPVVDATRADIFPNADSMGAPNRARLTPPGRDG
jgi:hypothetical protein